MNTIEFKNKVFVLSERLYPMVSRFLRNNENVEDAIQEIMLRLWVKRKMLKNHPNIEGFVFITARNYCIDVLKKKKLDYINMDSQIPFVEPSDNGHGEMEWKELNKLVNEIAQKLPQQQREIVFMRDFDGLDFIEIASILNITVEHTRVLLSRGRKQISNEFHKNYCYE